MTTDSKAATAKTVAITFSNGSTTELTTRLSTAALLTLYNRDKLFFDSGYWVTVKHIKVQEGEL